MSETAVEPLQPAHLVAGPGDEVEAALADAEAAAAEPLARALPDPAAGGRLLVEELLGEEAAPAVDPAELLGAVSGLAWTGAPVLAVEPAGAAGALPLDGPLSGAAELRGRLAGGEVLRVSDAHRWSGVLAALHDALTRGWRARVGAAVHAALVPATRSIADTTVVVALAGPLEVEVGGRAERLAAGDALVVPEGVEVVVGGDGEPTWWAELVAARFGATQVLEELRRRAGYWPLLRADLPADGALPPRSYAGSVLDAPEALSQALLAVFDDGTWAGALARWHAGLELAPRLDLASAAPERVVLPGPPAFLDRRLARRGASATVLATSGALLPLSGRQLEQLVELVRGDAPLADADPALGAALHQLGLRRRR